MNQLTVIEPSSNLLLSSLEVAQMIGKRHDHLLRDIDGYVATLNEAIDPKVGVNEKSIDINFEVNQFFIGGSYKDSIGRTLPCYQLTKKGCEFVANKMNGKKGVLFTAAYVTKFELMENSLNHSETVISPALKQSFEMQLIGVEYTSKILRVDDTSKIRMLEAAHKQHHVPTNHLPAYVEDEVTQSFSSLVKEYGIKLNTAKANTKLIELGLLEIKERPSSKGGTKEFKSLTEKGLVYGKNLINPSSPKETQPHYYPSKFLELIKLLESEAV